jgi:hypothetical protein
VLGDNLSDPEVTARSLDAPALAASSQGLQSAIAAGVRLVRVEIPPSIFCSASRPNSSVPVNTSYDGTGSPRSRPRRGPAAG